MNQFRLDFAESLLFVAAAVALLWPDSIKTVVVGQFFLYGCVNVLLSLFQESEALDSEQ